MYEQCFGTEIRISNITNKFIAMNENTKTMLAFFAGLAVGATLGILLAPEKGSDLREKLGDSLKKQVMISLIKSTPLLTQLRVAFLTKCNKLQTSLAFN